MVHKVTRQDVEALTKYEHDMGAAQQLIRELRAEVERLRAEARDFKEMFESSDARAIRDKDQYEAEVARLRAALARHVAGLSCSFCQAAVKPWFHGAPDASQT